MTASAAVRWGEHYFACEVCQIDERAPERDRFCRIGHNLRLASVKEYREAQQEATA